VSGTAKRVRVERNKIIDRMWNCVLRGDIAARNLVDANIASYLPGLLEEHAALERERNELKAEVARRAEQDRVNITLTEEQLRLRERSLGLRDDPPTATERRAPVQREQARGGRARGTITWSEHEAAWVGYARAFPGSARDQDAARIAERGGFGYEELADYLGHEPDTWRPC
jgi:hypothetical protein